MGHCTPFYSIVLTLYFGISCWAAQHGLHFEFWPFSTANPLSLFNVMNVSNIRGSHRFLSRPCKNFAKVVCPGGVKATQSVQDFR
jgi:hypothetical protein